MEIHSFLSSNLSFLRLMVVGGGVSVFLIRKNILFVNCKFIWIRRICLTNRRKFEIVCV